MEEKEDIVAYIESLDEINGKTEQEIKDGYDLFKAEKYKKDITAIAAKYGLVFSALDAFVREIVEREVSTAKNSATCSPRSAWVGESVPKGVGVDGRSGPHVETIGRRPRNIRTFGL